MFNCVFSGVIYYVPVCVKETSLSEQMPCPWKRCFALNFRHSFEICPMEVYHPINTINLLNGYIQIFQLYIRTNSELQPPYGPAINHAYRVVTKSLHANLQNGSHFARGNSCVLRLDFILRWRPEVSFYKTYTT